MSDSSEKPSAELRNNGITKKVSVKRTRTSPVKVFLRSVYWLISLTVLGIVLYVGFEAVWTIYQNTKS